MQEISPVVRPSGHVPVAKHAPAAFATGKMQRMQQERVLPPAECDVVVVGAGIVGLSAARELSLRHDGLRVAVLERERAIGAGQTGQTSGVIHAGIYYEPGSLKARLCVEGARELYGYCDEHGIPAARTGKLIVATRDSELPRLAELERRARANGVVGVASLAGDEIREVEPHATGIRALHSPGTGTVDFARVAGAFANDLESRAGSVALSCEVREIQDDDGGVRVEHSLGSTSARALVACAGSGSEHLALAAGAPAEPRIVPVRGAYLSLRRERAGLVRGNVFPVPDPALPFLGAHLTRRYDGSVLLGPTALLAGRLAWPGTWRLARHHWRAGLRELHHALRPRALVAEAQRLVPELRPADFEPGPVGVRAQAVDRDGSLVDDFVVSRTGRCVHIRNAPSPAATASLAIARLIADELEL
jgi:L-2-hydroxyglutarate oxidase